MTPDEKWAAFQRDLILERFGQASPELSADEREVQNRAGQQRMRWMEEHAGESPGLQVA